MWPTLAFTGHIPGLNLSRVSYSEIMPFTSQRLWWEGLEAAFLDHRAFQMRGIPLTAPSPSAGGLRRTVIPLNLLSANLAASASPSGGKRRESQDYILIRARKSWSNPLNEMRRDAAVFQAVEWTPHFTAFVLGTRPARSAAETEKKQSCALEQVRG